MNKSGDNLYLGLGTLCVGLIYDLDHLNNGKLYITATLYVVVVNIMSNYRYGTSPVHHICRLQAADRRVQTVNCFH